MCHCFGDRLGPRHAHSQNRQRGHQYACRCTLSHSERAEGLDSPEGANSEPPAAPETSPAPALAPKRQFPRLWAGGNLGAGHWASAQGVGTSCVVAARTSRLLGLERHHRELGAYGGRVGLSRS